MYKRIGLLVLVSLFVFAASIQAKTIGGINMEDTLKAGDTTLILNGAGIREKFFKDIYVAGLYLKEKSSDYKKIMEQDESMAIKIKIVSSLITSDLFKEACEQGFERTTNGNTKPLRSKINLAYTAFSGKFSVGDVFDLVYVKGVGTSFYKNGKLITNVDGLDFKAALFGIWIIDKPSHKNEKLRKGMLGLL
ncbi:MAG TPA: chalcone isomerase family protein [Smithella sp.]|nr:chalcone isomerase family protein [Smithella sp.]MDM7986461.1 chalcone isomerase family protein [Smithella sp.]HNY50269.1 chalcone isomerase family protein [Smithella sp.]HOG89898.1 chalcone isomerase family protein [Smithella sp.]HOU49812.1 chalcone isomerase family protein [Smithella sp.]